ncbi:MAG: hypothetical protein RLZZ301_1004 [Bacteroidota bacterium]|jgi:hypothetical protein
MSSTKLAFSPGSKNWIAKFFQLLETGVFTVDEELVRHQEQDLTHFISHQTGLIYGSANSFIFSNKLDKKKLTTDEQLRLLLLETLLFTYMRKHQGLDTPENFIQSLLDFYGKRQKGSMFDWIEGLFGEQPSRTLELILAERVAVKSTVFGANYWLNHLSNAFVFVDVILYKAYLENRSEGFAKDYSAYACSLLNGLIYAAYSDNCVEEKEQRILWHFLASAELPKKLRANYEDRILIGIPLKLLLKEKIEDKLLAQITYEFGHFLIQGTHEISQEEREKLRILGQHLQLTDAQMQASEEHCGAFLAQANADTLVVYQQSTASNYAYKETSKRWLRVIGRNRDKLIQEIKESKELMTLLQKSTREELSAAEKEQVKAQFLDILKSMPSLAIFLLPGGTLLLPIIMKLVPELIPSSFKINEIEKQDPNHEL